MDIHGDQILTQFKTYGTPQVVADYLEQHGIELDTLRTNDLPAHGVAAVKELMAYTTGVQVVMLIAAAALGQMDVPEPEAVDEPVADESGDETGEAGPLDAEGNEIVEGARVVIVEIDKDGGKVEGGGSTGEVESIELRGSEHIVQVTTDPEPGHTTGNLIAVRADLLQLTS